MYNVITGESTNLRLLIGAGALVAGSLLVAGCGEQPEGIIKANLPATLVEKRAPSHWVAGTGYDHWETDYLFTLQQCGRRDDAADKAGCLVMTIAVGATTYNKYEDGDSIVFEQDQHEAIAS